MTTVSDALIDPCEYKVLVVDDVEANRAMLSRRLERLGYRVDDVDSGAAALSQIDATRPDIILLDYMMPQMNGVEVVRQIRAGRAELANMPIIMVTARAESDATVESLSAGADDYVTKPIDFDVLHARIKLLLAKHRGTDQLRRINAVLDEKVTLRTMTMADLESDLMEEIERRRTLEEQLREGGTSHNSDHETALAPLISQIASAFDLIYQSAADGRVPNLAQLTAMRELIIEAEAQVR